MKSFWIDNQARTDNVKDESSVPLYDREFTLNSSLDGSATFERFNTYVLSFLKHLRLYKIPQTFIPSHKKYASRLKLLCVQKFPIFWLYISIAPCTHVK